MPQVVTIGVGGDYTSVNAWIASADYSDDHGVGNPAIGQIDGILTGTVTFNTAATPNGALLTAKPGQEYDGTNSSTSAGVTSSGITIMVRDDGIEISFIFVESTGSGSIAFRAGAFEGVDTDIHDIGVKSDLTNFAATGLETYSAAPFAGNIERVIVEGAGGSGIWLRDEITGTIDHNTIVDASASGTSSFRAGLRSDDALNTVTNTMAIMHASSISTAFSGSFSAGTDFNAGDDTSAPGSNSVDNITSADLVNKVGGDFRTSASSSLATAGSGGGFIGAILEIVSGVIIPKLQYYYSRLRNG